MPAARDLARTYEYRVNTKEGLEPSRSIEQSKIITFLLLLPWLGALRIGRRDMARTHRNARQESKTNSEATFRVTSRRLLRITSVNGRK